MVDKMFHMRSVEEVKQGNNPASEKPQIGICFDWRVDHHTNHYVYVPSIIENYRTAIIDGGGQPFVISYTDELDSFKHLLDGYIIPGGRDIHPKFYGQEVHGSQISEQADIHYNFQKQAFEGLPSACPILGICWGSQFLNVVTGGTLIQDMTDKAEHYKKRAFKVDSDSWLSDKVGSTGVGNCYHHQGLDKLGKDVVVTAIDDFSKIPHAWEVRQPGRSIKAILWHPELTFRNESNSERSETSRNIFSAFVDQCKAYKQTKTNN